MQLRNKIISHFLLAIYLLVVLHDSVNHSHTNELKDANLSTNTHQHDTYTDIHHEHKFHVGVFHLLGHLFEDLNHLNDLADDHIVDFQKSSTKKIVNQNPTTDFFIGGYNIIVFNEDVENLTNPPPYFLFLLHQLTQPNTSLRAPPALV